MAGSWNRRQVVKTLGAGALLGAAPRWSIAPAGRRRQDTFSLAVRLIETDRADMAKLLIPRVRDGLTWQELQAAVFLAGVHEVQPRPVGFKLHCVMVVESIFQLAEASPEPDRLAAALWNLDDFKNSQQRDVAEGDWALGAAPRATASSAEDAARELGAALQGRDDERADRALVAALPLLAREELFEVLWPFAVSDFSNLGHKVIFPAQVDRVLQRIGPAHVQPALRSLVYGLLDQREGAFLDEYRASVEAAADLADDWEAGERDPERSLHLSRSIRHASPGEARSCVIEALADGLDPSSVWDGLRLAATDLFARAPGLLPVHPTTVTNALFYVHRTSRRESTRRVALLQAAVWLPLFREALPPRVGFSMEQGGVDAILEARERAIDEAVAIEALFESPSVERTLACLASDSGFERYAASLRHYWVRGSREHHQPKYAAALLEDVTFAHPHWRATLCASALEYLPSARTPETARGVHVREIVAAVRR